MAGFCAIFDMAARDRQDCLKAAWLGCISVSFTNSRILLSAQIKIVAQVSNCNKNLQKIFVILSAGAPGAGKNRVGQGQPDSQVNRRLIFWLLK